MDAYISKPIDSNMCIELILGLLKKRNHKA